MLEIETLEITIKAWIGTERVGYEKQKLMLLFVNRSLVRQNFSRFVNLLVGLNQKLLIALHGLEIKELSWFKELNEKGSLLEIVRCMAYVVEWLFVGQKMQTRKVAKENGDEIEFFVQSVVKHNEVVAGSTQYMPTKSEKDQTVSKMATLTKKVRIADLIGVVEVCISLKAAFSRLVCLLKDMEVLERQEVETREFATLDWRQYKLIKEFDVVIMDKKKVAGAGSTRVKTTFPSFHFLPP
ncbi:T1N24.2 gene product [Arabidopsis thaliana]|uniref:T1N24.2 protein n=1 Tax=Arabidopsis thaliana TaxID=3702 RepID=Q9XGZ1_ARATH|nr:T1N24.2 gene product [Arabidopsis thaliana]